MLKATRLTKRYNGVVALDTLDLTIQQGEVFCLLGANGAGKTTTINLFLNFIEPYGWTATINGIDVTKEPLETEEASSRTFPRQVMLYRNLTGSRTSNTSAALAGRPITRAAQLLEFFRQVGLRRRRRRTSGSATYSKGMRQKVGIAIAMAKEARALLLDEPTSGLDPKASNEFSELLKQMSEEGVAVLMATHDLFRAKESRHARRHHEARAAGGDARHRRHRSRRSRTPLSRAHARLIDLSGAAISSTTGVFDDPPHRAQGDARDVPRRALPRARRGRPGGVADVAGGRVETVRRRQPPA